MNYLLRVLLLGLSILLAIPTVLAEVVNINKADAETLQQYLQGIGPVKSQAIVDYRNKHGSFKSIDDLRNVEGIGEATLSKNRQNMSVGKGLSKIPASEKTTDKSSVSGKSSTATKTQQAKPSTAKTKEAEPSKSTSKDTDAKDTVKAKSSDKKTSSKEAKTSKTKTKEKSTSSKTKSKDKDKKSKQSKDKEKKSKKETKSSKATKENK